MPVPALTYLRRLISDLLFHWFSLNEASVLIGNQCGCVCCVQIYLGRGVVEHLCLLLGGKVLGCQRFSAQSLDDAWCARGPVQQFTEGNKAHHQSNIESGCDLPERA